jgi:hypothetical protein
MPKYNSLKHSDNQLESESESSNSNVPNGFNGQYEFNIKEILKRAYLLSTQNNWTLLLGLLCIFAITFVIYFIYLDAFEITDFSLLMTENSPLTQGQQAIIELTLTVVLAPLWTGVTMLAISTNRGVSQSALNIFEFYKIIPALALASCLVSIFFTMGIALFFIPGFYIFTVTTFTLPLIADKKLGPISAIIFSIRMSNVYLWKMLQLYLIFLLMLFVVILSFGFAYFWIGPLYFNAKAILYDDLFRNSLAKSDDERANMNKGVFNA